MIRAGEFERITLLLDAFREEGGLTSSPDVPLGPGDDAAILSARGPLAITTDTLVEGVHFRRKWISFEQLGARSLAVNLSDLAAMGARPVAFTCALNLPIDLDEEALRQLGQGLARHARRWGVVLAGGNFSRAGELSITVTALGSVGPRTLRRDGARPGDVVLLAGPVGVAGAELEWLEQGRALPAGRSALLDPEPLVDIGLTAVNHAQCGIDVSDGLAQDLGHIAAASGVAVRVRYTAIPRTERFMTLTGEAPPDRVAQLLMAGGDDYALLLACPKADADALAGSCGAVIIGTVEQGSGVTVEELPPGVRLSGHDHFA